MLYIQLGVKGAISQLRIVVANFPLDLLAVQFRQQNLGLLRQSSRSIHIAAGKRLARLLQEFMNLRGGFDLGIAQLPIDRIYALFGGVDHVFRLGALIP